MKLRENGKYSKIQHCEECKLRVEPLMIIGNEPDDWVWPECFKCGDIICSNCSIETDNELWCSLCYQSSLFYN